MPASSEGAQVAPRGGDYARLIFHRVFVPTQGVSGKSSGTDTFRTTNRFSRHVEAEMGGRAWKAVGVEAWREARLGPGRAAETLEPWLLFRPQLHHRQDVPPTG